MRRALVFCLAVAIAAAAFAQEEDPEITKLKDMLKTRSVSLSMSDTSLSNVLSFLRDITGLNVVIDSKCDSDTLVTLRANNVKLETALKLILEPVGYDYIVQKGGIIFVSTKKRIAELRGGTKKETPTDLKPGELLFIMKDGSRIKGKVALKEWKLKTAYGELVIPTGEIGAVRFPHETKEDEKAPAQDEVKTVRFTVTGELEFEKVEVDTGKGKLTIPKSDIKEIVFPRPSLEKSFEVKPDGEWLDTGMKLTEGDALRIAAKGLVDGEHTPDSEQTPLIGRIGEDGKEFRVGSAYSAKAAQEGKLYFRIRIPEGEKDLEGSYNVKVKIQK